MMFRKNILRQTNKRNLFQLLVVLYFIGFVGLLLMWNIQATGFRKNVIHFDSLLKEHIVPSRTDSKRHVNPAKSQDTHPRSDNGRHTNIARKTEQPAVKMQTPIGNDKCFRKHILSFLSNKTITLSEDPVCSWLKSEISGENFYGYGDMFVRLHNVILNPKHAEGRQGGEDISSVMMQQENLEFLVLKPGYFSILCTKLKAYQFTQKNHLTDWMKSLECRTDDKVSGLTKQRGFTIAVKRYEYVNLYHTMTDYYNAFLMLLIFDMDPNNTTILWIDAHPYGTLDPVWQTLFSSTIRAGTLKEAVLFEDMVWNVMGYDSPLNHHDRPFVPYLEEFREFFLTRHGVSTTKPLNCSKLNVMFIWRRDYVAHPRNPSGLVKRKIQNENELLETIRKAVPGHNVTGVQLDSLPMKQQLELIARTDVFLGMHGAGLAHTLFLPKHAGLIELYPVYWSAANRHFRAMAQWRGLHYQLWQNRKPENEKDKYYTYIPPDTVLKMFLEIKSKMCKTS